MTNGIELKIPITSITPQVVAELDALCRKYPGTAKLRMTFYDQEAGHKLQMVASERTIDADNEFVEAIEKLGLTYKLERAA